MLAAATATLTSCKKDFLDIQPTHLVSDVSILADSMLFQNYVLNRYLGVKLSGNEGEGSPPGFGRAFEYAMLSSITDESMANHDDNTWLIQRGQLAPENTGMAGTIWARSYRSIREVNYALTNIDKVNMSSGNKNRLTGELKFIRAFRYHDLIRNYGGAVLVGDKVTSLTDDLQDPSLFKRSTIKESIDYAVAELDDAAQRLPLNNDNSWVLGRATKGAALALKSRLLLYAASPLYILANDPSAKPNYANGANTSDPTRWQAAAAAAKAVMDLNKYSLYQGGYRQLFLSQDNNEVIFQRLYTKNARHVPMELNNGPNGYNGWGGNVPLQNMVDAYPMSNGKLITDPTSGYDPQNPYVNRDPRFYATILFNGASYRGSTVETYTPGGKDSQEGPSNWNTSKSGYYLRKFMDDNNPIDNPWEVAGFQPWIYFRYAEILLNYAEAQNEAAGPDASVYNAINAIRSRASVNMPDLPLGLNKEQMRAAIRAERRIELAFEEHRFYDVRRWTIAEVTENIPAYGVTVTRSGNTFNYNQKVALSGRRFDPQHYWLPIPRFEIQASGGQLTQNPFY